MEPITATTIIRLAFSKAFEKTIEKFTESAWNKIDDLRKMVGNKIKSQFPKNADKFLQEADSGSKDALSSVADYLKVVMKEEPEFAEELKALVREIQTSSKSTEQVGIRDLTGGELKSVQITLTVKNQAEDIKQTGIDTIKDAKIEDMNISLDA